MHLMSQSLCHASTIMSNVNKPNVQNVIQNVFHVLKHRPNPFCSMFLWGLRNFYGPCFHPNAMINVNLDTNQLPAQLHVH